MSRHKTCPFGKCEFSVTSNTSVNWALTAFREIDVGSVMSL